MNKTAFKVFFMGNSRKRTMEKKYETKYLKYKLFIDHCTEKDGKSNFWNVVSENYSQP